MGHLIHLACRKKAFLPFEHMERGGVWGGGGGGVKAKKLNTEIQKGEVLTWGDLCSALVLVDILPVPSIMLELFPASVGRSRARRPLIGRIA